MGLRLNMKRATDEIKQKDHLRSEVKIIAPLILTAPGLDRA